ncbi:MAG: hypothetical protein ABUS57_00640 [Pseudomonadota bacterium]
MKASATDLAKIALLSHASWENEGGATRFRGEARAPSWMPSSVIMPAAPEARGTDHGIADTHSLVILRVSLLLLIPTLGLIVAFWSSVARAGS